MNNIVRFSIGCMGVIMLAFIAVMYIGLRKTSSESQPEGQTEEQVRHWMEKTFTDKERELVKLGKECTFEGEDRRYRLAELRVKGAPDNAAVERYVLQSKPNGMVTFHWPLGEFIAEKKAAAKTESTPERAAWLERRWAALAKEMGLSEWGAASGPQPQVPAP